MSLGKSSPTSFMPTRRYSTPFPHCVSANCLACLWSMNQSILGRRRRDHGTTTERCSQHRLTRGRNLRAAPRPRNDDLRGATFDIIARGIAEEKVTVIPNAVDTLIPFDPGGEPDLQLRQNLGLASSTVIGFIGSFYAYEGLDLILDAFRILARLPDVRVSRLLVADRKTERSRSKRV